MNLAFPKPRPRLLAKRAIALTKASQWRELRRVVLKRDGYRCRACGKGGALDAHHVVMRSLGGKDEARNLITLCLRCHQDVHGHVLILRWQECNPARTVRFERVTILTGKRDRKSIAVLAGKPPRKQLEGRERDYATNNLSTG